MKNKLRKLLCTILSVITATTLFACKSPSDSSSGGGSGDPVRPKGKDIVIYAGGPSEYAWTEGSEESDVIDYIEQKYYEDTGISLNFKISFWSTDMTSKADAALSGGAQLDLIVSKAGGDGCAVQYVMGSGSGSKYYDLTDILDEYGKNIVEKTKGEPIQTLTTRENEIVGIPSVVNPYNCGILVRKDWMKACGYTDNAAEAGDEYELVDNFQTFTAMCLKMKEKYGLNHVITGAPWDLEKVLTLGAYNNAGYFDYKYDEEKQLVVPGFTTDEYQKVLALEYDWVKRGLVAKSSNNILLEAGEANFISGSTGVFVLDPTVQHLIKVARSCKAANAEAEFTVLGPLPETKESAKKGFMRTSSAMFAACVMENSSRAIDIVKFVNWSYSSVENYNLCKYGVEGKHWVNNGDGTYSYPEGKDNYLVRPPYSGILAFVENQNVSDLTFKGYSEQELGWIEAAKNPENYFENGTETYLWPVVGGSVRNNYVSAKAVVYGDLVLKAWIGDTEPTKSVFDSFISTYFSSGGTAYSEMLTKAYNQIKNMRG